MDGCGKTAGAVADDQVTGSEASAFDEQEYRGMQSLCARGAGSGERSAGVKGQSPLAG